MRLKKKIKEAEIPVPEIPEKKKRGRKKKVEIPSEIFSAPDLSKEKRILFEECVCCKQEQKETVENLISKIARMDHENIKQRKEIMSLKNKLAEYETQEQVEITVPEKKRRRRRKEKPSIQSSQEIDLSPPVRLKKKRAEKIPIERRKRRKRIKI